MYSNVYRAALNATEDQRFRPFTIGSKSWFVKPRMMMKLMALDS